MAAESIVALGTFDGVHAGHRALLCAALELGATRGQPALAYTFSNHPLAGLGLPAPKLLMSWPEREAAIRALGLGVAAEEFTTGFARLSPGEFAGLLKQRFNISAAVVGFNYTFGAGGRGDVRLLQELGAELGFDVLEIPPTLFGGQVVSSPRIRERLEAGDVEAANAMLCARYTLEGEVVKNRHIGSGLGFPTANIRSEKALPKDGVYASIAEVGGVRYRAVTNVGNNPTVKGGYTTIETHLLGFSGDLYGRRMAVGFERRLRGERHFASLGELSAQIAQDAAAAREVLAGVEL